MSWPEFFKLFWAMYKGLYSTVVESWTCNRENTLILRMLIILSVVISQLAPVGNKF